jgi:hypothetical protein
MLVIGLFLFSIIYLNVFPGGYGNGVVTSTPKPVILYYNFGEIGVTFNVGNFSSVVAFTKSHGFNTLMVVIYTNHIARFNDTDLLGFYNYAKSQNVTFVPSYYIESVNDAIDTKGFSWVNLDMESLSQIQQKTYYDNISSTVPLVSVTQPYGEANLFYTKMLIVETYASLPKFWFDQIWYSHGGTICSVHIRYVHDEHQYQSEFQYCLKYSDGVMVFDYPQLVRAGY